MSGAPPSTSEETVFGDLSESEAMVLNLLNALEIKDVASRVSKERLLGLQEHRFFFFTSTPLLERDALQRSLESLKAKGWVSEEKGEKDDFFSITPSGKERDTRLSQRMVAESERLTTNSEFGKHWRKAMFEDAWALTEQAIPEDGYPWYNLMQKGQAKYFVDQMASLSRDSRCLDLGCGSGGVLAWIAKAHPDKRFVGIDQDEKQIAQARENYKSLPNIEFVVSEILDFTAKTHLKFSAIWLIDTLFFLKAEGAALNLIRQCYALLEDAGKIFIFQGARPAKNPDLALDPLILPIEDKRSRLSDIVSEFGSKEDCNLEVENFTDEYDSFWVRHGEAIEAAAKKDASDEGKRAKAYFEHELNQALKTLEAGCPRGRWAACIQKSGEAAARAHPREESPVSSASAFEQ